MKVERDSRQRVPFGESLRCVLLKTKPILEQFSISRQLKMLVENQGETCVYAQNTCSPSTSLRYLIVWLGDNRKARSDSLAGRGTSRGEALFNKQPKRRVTSWQARTCLISGSSFSGTESDPPTLRHYRPFYLQRILMAEAT